MSSKKKKQPVDMSSKSNTITEVKTRKRGIKLEPVKVEFQHGKLDPTVIPDAAVGLYLDNLSDDYVAVCRVGDMPYMGTVESKKEEPQRTFIAVRNKATKKVKLVELGKVSLTPVVQFPTSTNPLLIEEENNEDGTSNKLSKKELQREFVQKFGMLKGQRIYERVDRLTVDASTVRSNLENAASKTSFEESELVPPPEESFDKLLPPRNENALKGSEVYQLEDIVTPEDFKSLEALAKYCLTAESLEIESWSKEDQYSPMFTQRLMLLRRPNRMTEEQQKMFIAALNFAELLIKLLNLPSGSLRRNDPLPGDFPSDVRRRVLERYVPVANGQRIFAQQDRDRVICHLMALLLIISECFIDMKLLSDSLYMPVERLKILIQIVGAHFSLDKASGVATATLRIPLAGPPKKSFQARKKGGKK